MLHYYLEDIKMYTAVGAGLFYCSKSVNRCQDERRDFL